MLASARMPLWLRSAGKGLQPFTFMEALAVPLVGAGTVNATTPAGSALSVLTNAVAARALPSSRTTLTTCPRTRRKP